MKMLMVSGDIFGGYTVEQGPRGTNAGWSTSAVMVDAGSTVGDRHYLNIDLMLTAELWTLPQNGYPLLLQIGEENSQGKPFIDAQHPHSSPFMGITFSDTIRLGDAKDALKLFFSPRGETTDGPTAFMHRPTGMINPDAPLGHHIGQDVGHITSTVFGASLKLGNTHFELSAFHGAESNPTQVDLPIGSPDSVAVRVIEEFSETMKAMASWAFVNKPEPAEPDIDHVLRFSGSVYNRIAVFDSWTLDNAVIYGGITDYDHASLLNSFAEEFWLHANRSNIWGRVEILQRTPAELNIPSVVDQNSGRWTVATTLGYTHIIAKLDGESLGLGASVTKDFLPGEFAGAYGGNPWSGKIFLQLKGMEMWEL